MAAPQCGPPPPAVAPATVPNRGRALIATREILPGEIILSESPIILYPSSLSSLSHHCAACFRPLPSNPHHHRIPCPNSCPSLFCSPLCLSRHPSPLCHHLLQNPNPSQDLLFLFSAHSLSLTSPSSFASLLSLHHTPTPTAPLPINSPFPPDLTAALLSLDRLNAFALMQPDRSVRAYAIYPSAALFNHDCLPNACRFDYIDTNGPDIIIRAIHEISQGREVCLSYFPVNWGFRERQERLWEDYGFRCECDRCLVEREWKDEDEEEAAMEEDEEEGDFPHAYFFVKFVCDAEGCGGTLAPLVPTELGAVSDVMECNVCGRLRKEEEGGDGDGGDGDMMDGGDDDD